MMKKLLFLVLIFTCGMTSMSAQFSSIGFRGTATSVGWDGPNDISMSTSDGIIYTIQHVSLVGGVMKFRENNNWDVNWGGSSFPSGTATQGGGDIPVNSGVYNLTFNKNTLAYSFTYLFPTIGMRGDATTTGWNGATDVLMDTNDGVTYTAQNIAFTYGDVKFRKDNNWDNSWGGSWPSGYGLYNTGADNIPAKPGKYNISFNSSTLAYSFTPIAQQIGIRGPATTVGWNGPDDIFLTTTDNIHYSVNNVTLTQDVLKFRRNNNWDESWGGTTFPSGTGLYNTGGNDIQVQAGQYNISFNAATFEYNFDQFVPMGIRGSATSVDWLAASNDIPMTTTDGVNYTADHIVLISGGLKFRENNDWPNNVGGNTFPTGTGIVDQNGVDIPCQPGMYNIAYNRTTHEYSFTLVTIGIRGSATTTGWFGPTDVPMISSDGITYTAENVVLTSGELKFRENSDWTYNWGGNTWPSGTAIFNQFGVNVQAQAGVYDVTFNRQTLAFSFVFQNCALTTTWNGNAWSNGTPDSYAYIADFAGNYNTSANGNVTACSANVAANANVTIDDAGNFDLKGALSVDNNASFSILNNGALIQKDNVSNTGIITVSRTANLRRLDYCYWGTPVTGQNLRDFSLGTVQSRFYTLNEPDNVFESVFTPEVDGGLGENPTTYQFNPASGYMVRAPNNFPEAPATAQQFTGTWEGVPNNGDQGVSVTNIGQAFNLVGNPYPSPIDAALFLQENPGTLYFWTHMNQGAASGANYATCNLAGQTAASVPASFTDPDNPDNTITSETPNGFIQTGQGFLFHSISSEIAFFSNSMRAINTSNQFFRMSSGDKSRLWLNLSDASTGFNQIMIGYMNNATAGFDVALDGKQINKGTVLSSVIGDGNYAIQARSAFTDSDIVPLSFTAQNAGNYSISLDHTDGLFSGEQNIYIQDNLLGLQHNLKESAYAFTSDAGTFANRFSVVYTATTLGILAPEIASENVVIFKQQSDINISAGNMQISDVTIFDIQGRQVYARSGINSDHAVISGLSISKGIYTITVNTEKGKVSRKITY